MFKIRLTTDKLLLLIIATFFSVNSFADDCRDVQFGADVRERFPQIDQACLAILDYEGEQYIKLSGKVVTANSRVLSLRWKRQDGTYIRDVFRTKKLDPEFRINIGGRNVRPSTLIRGQEINTYVRLGGELATLMSDQPIEMVVQQSTPIIPIDFDPAPTEMPTTASLLPTLGLLGVLSLAFGGLVRVYRKVAK